MNRVYGCVVKFRLVDSRLIVSAETNKGSKPILVHDFDKKKQQGRRRLDAKALLRTSAGSRSEN